MTERRGASGRSGGILPAGLAETLATLPKIDRRLTATLAAATVLTGMAPVGYILATNTLIDRLSGSSRTVPVAAIVLLCVWFAATETLTPFFTAMAETFGYWINRDLRMRLMRASLGPPGVAHVEDAATQEVLMRAVRIGSSGLTPGAAIAGLATIGRGYVQGAGCAIVLATFRWWLGPLLFASAVIVSMLLLSDFVRAANVITGQGRSLRRATYFRDLTIDPSVAGELRLFSLGGWALDRFRDRWTAAMEEVWAARRPRVGRAVAGIVVVTLCMSGAIALLTSAVRSDSISLGSFVMYLGALVGLLPMFAMSLQHLNVTSGAEVMSAVSAFESSAGGSGSPSPAAPPTAPAPAPRGDLVFDRVRFTYPHAADPVLEGVTFEVPSGSSVAIVGLNGAGKTTLIKLLARLYDPSDGQITWAGRDITSIDMDLWRQHLAVLFQDFLRLPFTAADNVRAGAIRAPQREGALERAAVAGNAVTVVDGLPRGWETRLSKGFEGGVDLSGGQWQRVAAARAFFALHHGAGLLILDEPSAALDIRAEAEFFDRFHDLRDVTRILISHRLATVRRADRIVVLDAGIVREQGTHASLMEDDGVYASLFRTQKKLLVE